MVVVAAAVPVVFVCMQATPHDLVVLALGCAGDTPDTCQQAVRISFQERGDSKWRARVARAAFLPLQPEEARERDDRQERREAQQARSEGKVPLEGPPPFRRPGDAAAQRCILCFVVVQSVGVQHPPCMRN